MTSLEYYMMYGTMPETGAQLMGGPENFGGRALGGSQSALGFSTPGESTQAAKLKSKGQQVLSAITQGVTDPYYAFTPGEDNRRQAARERVLANVAQAMTDPMMGTFVPAKGMEVGAFTDLLSKKTMREIADNTARLNIEKGRMYQTQKLNTLYDHPELYNEYPELAKTRSSVSWQSDLGREGYYNSNEVNTRPQLLALNNTKKGTKEVVGHETQHAVQENANWPRGGTPQGFDELPVTINEAVLASKIGEITHPSDWKQIFGPDNPYGIAVSAKELIDKGALSKVEVNKLNNIAKDNGFKSFDDMKNYLDQQSGYRAPESQYKRLWGEEQARRTANRMEMTAEERMGRPYGEKLVERPDGTFTYGGKGATDVPNLEDLILRDR